MLACRVEETQTTQCKVHSCTTPFIVESTTAHHVHRTTNFVVLCTTGMYIVRCPEREIVGGPILVCTRTMHIVHRSLCVLTISAHLWCSGLLYVVRECTQRGGIGFFPFFF